MWVGSEKVNKLGSRQPHHTINSEPSPQVTCIWYQNHTFHHKA